ncbi:hypothetical protein OG292_19670 [Streptomyces sp. NBC_01511]|uniref:zinc finger domain-containing protein n=1 Tax=Streptomyces sp. NBC_01511 TaxID=2903889 RepID=UPI00386804CB
MARLRFPQLAVRCSWCHAAPGDLCTNPQSSRPRGTGTHDARRIAWLMTSVCPECHATPDQPCTAHISGNNIPLPDVHPSRTTAAEAAYATQHAHDQQLQIAITPEGT